MILKELLVNRLIRVWELGMGSLSLRIEIATMFSNLLHFISKDGEVVRGLIDMGVDNIIITTL